MNDTAVVVSGASTGIGRATALHLDSLGLSVFAGVRRTEDGEALRRDASNRLTPLRLDVTDSADVARAAEIVGDAVRDSRLAGIVNNADALRIELRPWGIGVSLLEPGAVKTPIWNKGVEAGSELLRHAPPQLRDLYGAAVEIATKTAIHENETGVEPLEVARAVEHALLSPRPRARYPVGRQARILIPLTRFIPDRLKDELILRVSGLPRTADRTGRSAPRQARSASSVTAPV